MVRIIKLIALGRLALRKEFGIGLHGQLLLLHGHLLLQLLDVPLHLLGHALLLVHNRAAVHLHGCEDLG